PEPSEEKTILLKAPPIPARRPAAAAVPLTDEEEAKTVLVRGPARGGPGGARPKQAAAPEPESEEPATILMKGAPPPKPPSTPPSMPPPPPPEGSPVTVTAPSPVMVDPRRSTLTLALGGIGLLLFLIVMTT